MQPPLLPPTAPAGLTHQTLTAPKERTYFVFVLPISIAVWLVLAVTLIGLAYAALFGFFLWLGNGLLTAYLRAEAVRVGPRPRGLARAMTREPHSVCDRAPVMDAPPPSRHLGSHRRRIGT